MSFTTIRLTEFQIKKLRCMGNAGRSSPYRITVYPGISLGETGPVAGSMLEAANQNSFEHRGSLRFKRLLNLFRM